MSTMDSYGEVEDDHVKISEEEGSEFMEFPKEDDNTVLLSTIQAQFPNVIGLKYRGSSGAWRALRAVENVLDAPKGGWSDRVYCLTVNETAKRKAESGASGQTKRTRLNPLLQDMAVMNLPFQTTEEELREYFEKNYGDLEYCEVKTFRDTGKSRGYGFIRFKDEVSAKEAATAEHHMHGRKVDVKQKQEKPMKLFVGRLPDGTTQEQLREYFATFGELTDVYIPTPFRNFGFITYGSTDDGKNVLLESHALDGTRLNVMERNQDSKDKQGSRSDRGERGDRGSDRGDRGSDRGDRGGGGRSSSHYDKYGTNDSKSGFSSRYDRNSSSQGSSNYTNSSSQGSSNISYDKYGTGQTTASNYSAEKYGSVSEPTSNSLYGITNTPSQQPMSNMDPDLKSMLLQYLSGK